MKRLKFKLLFFMLLFVSFNSYAQYMAGYPDTINGLDLSKTPVTKADVELALGIALKYRICEYPDEPLGTDEYYDYQVGEQILHLHFIDGNIQEFYTDSPDYLIFGKLRVGGSIQELRNMQANNFGMFYIEEIKDTGYRTTEIKLGDDTLRVSHKDGIITFIWYQAIF